MSAHTVFVLAVDGRPLTPTIPAHARRLLRAGVARPVWSKFGTFGIRMLRSTREETSITALGVDQGSKFEGYAVVCGTENSLAVKLDLPHQEQIVRKFEAHCSNALALACAVSAGRRVEPGKFLVVDDTYRPVRRRLHDTQPTKGGVRAPYNRGTVSGYRKGLLIGIATGTTGRLCGTYTGAFQYYDQSGRRYRTKHILWASTHFIIRPGVPAQRRPRPSLAG
jgi:RRXRR protein